MFYYLFRIYTDKPDIVPDYYVLNNQYIGYIGIDTNHVRATLERHSKVSSKLQYQLFATGTRPDFDEVHTMNCESKRFTMEEAEAFVKKYKFKKYKDDTWYEEYRPDRNSSKTILRSLDKTKKIEGY